MRKGEDIIPIFDEVIKAEFREEELETSNDFRSATLQQKHFVSKLANKLQETLAKQKYSGDFDLEEGLLNSSKLTRLIMDPLNYYLQKEKETESNIHLTILIDNSGSMGENLFQ